MANASAEIFYDTSLLFHRQKEVFLALKKGEVCDLRISQSFAADKIVAFALEQGFLKPGLKLFPDPRAWFEVPMDASASDFASPGRKELA